MSVSTPLRELILINVGRVNGIMQTIAEDVGDLAAENTRLRAENAELEDRLQREEAEAIFWERQHREPQGQPVKDIDTSAPSLKENGENFTGPYHYAILPGGRVVSYEEAKHIKDGAIPVTAEAIRASEPGSTWEDRHGAAWEWTGEGMAYHSQFGDLGEESLTEYVVQQSGPFTRSTAAPRGDYSATPRLTVHALNIAPVGSTVSTPGKTRTKHDDGTWFIASTFGQYTRRTSEELLALGYANATLTYPERGNDEQL